MNPFNHMGIIAQHSLPPRLLSPEGPSTPTNLAEQLGGIFSLALPETVLVLAACVLFLGAAWRSNRHFWAAVSLGVIVLAAGMLWLTVQQLPLAPPNTFLSLAFDPLAVFVKVVALVGGAVLVLFSWDEVT